MNYKIEIPKYFCGHISKLSDETYNLYSLPIVINDCNVIREMYDAVDNDCFYTIGNLCDDMFIPKYEIQSHKTKQDTFIINTNNISDSMDF